MSRIERWFEDKLRVPYGDKTRFTIGYRYVQTGDRALLRGLKQVRDWEYEWDIYDIIASPNALTEYDKRSLHVLAALGQWRYIGMWLDRYLPKEGQADDFHGVATSVLEEHGFTKLAPGQLVVPWAENLAFGGRPTSAGRYLLSLSDRDLQALARSLASSEYSGHSLLDFALDFDQRRVRIVARELLRPADTLRLPPTCRALLVKGNGAFDKDVLDAFRGTKDTHDKFLTGQELDKYNHALYGREALEAARTSLAGAERENRHDIVCQWMVQIYGVQALPDLVAYIRRTANTTGYSKPAIISDCVAQLGAEALPVVLAGLEGGGKETPFTALSHLIEIGGPDHQDTIRRHIEGGLRAQESDLAIRYIIQAAKWNPSAVSDTLWGLTESTSKPIREAAARALTKIGDEALPRAVKLLQHRKAELRLTAVIILSPASTPAARQALEDRLESEENDDVREAILAAVQDAWESAGKDLTREYVESRAQAGFKRMKWPPARWVGDLGVPGLSYKDGAQMPEEILRYLLSRQSSCPEIRPSLELKPLYKLIDRATTADFALALLNAYIASGADAKDKWALASASMLGDDRIVPVLSSQIKDWAEHSRGKLAEYAVQALALLATDRALLAIDSIAMRYRTKMKNIGAAASEAFAAAAASLGVTPDELGDRVVPWLGFEPGKPREVQCGDRKVLARIGLDFKPQFHDVDKNKRVSSLPTSAPDPVRAEFKELGALLREVSKAQIRRMEAMMVQQRRWPVSDWSGLFLKHPIMMPFGIRLIWGAYDGSTQLTSTFRALEDQTLTDNADNTVELVDDCTVGIVHPLELGDQARQQWQAHLTDYEVEPPFPQLARPVVSVTQQEKQLRFHKGRAGTQLNGLTFKGRAERLGWRRGSVCDAGMITAYVKSFPSAGVDAFLGLEGMYVGIDMYSDIKLGEAFFVHSGSVKIGIYVYDEPNSAVDPRLIEFGQMSPIVFSEVMGDLQKIAGGKQEEDE